MRRPEEAGLRNYVTVGWTSCAGQLYRHWPRVRLMDHVDAYVHRILVRTWLDEKAWVWRREEPAETRPELVVLPSDVVERLELLDAAPGRGGAALLLRPFRRGDR